MTRTGPSKPVSPSYAHARLKKAEAFHEATRIIVEAGDRLHDDHVATTLAVLAAIAYVDALTAGFGGRVNQKDHMAAVKLLRDVLGNALPDDQERRLDRLLGRKDEAAYGVSIGRLGEAELVLEALNSFGTWARNKLITR